MNLLLRSWALKTSSFGHGYFSNILTRTSKGLHSSKLDSDFCFTCHLLESLSNGDNEIRTRDLLLARQALSQLSYTPKGLSYILFENFKLKLWAYVGLTSSPKASAFSLCFLTMGLSGLEPPTSRLSGVRSNRLSYKPLFFKRFGSHLLSHTVSSAVPSAAWGLTIVFGMGTGVSPKRIATRKPESLARSFRA